MRHLSVVAWPPRIALGAAGMLPALARVRPAAGQQAAFRADWNAFLQRYGTTEGRVGDTGNADVTYSEGQGWAGRCSSRNTPATRTPSTASCHRPGDRSGHLGLHPTRLLVWIVGGAAGGMFEVVDDGRVPRAVVVRGTGGFTGQSAIFSGPKSRSLAEAYARCLNAGAAYQRRRTDPGFNGRCALDPRRRDPCMSGA